MRSLGAVSVFILSVALTFLPQQAGGQDLTGRWTTTVEWKDGNGGSHTEFPSFEIKMAGGVLAASSLRRDGTAGAEIKINADGPKVHLYRFMTLDDGEHLFWKLELKDGKLVGTYSSLHARPSKWIYDRELEVALVRGEPLAINLNELEWGPPHGGNGFPVGVRTAPQGVDPISGGNTYYAMFPAGSHFDLHWHTHDEYAVVVAGSPTIRLGSEDHVLAVGGYIVIPGGLNHSWTVPQGGVDAVILVRRAGPPDFHFVKD